MKNLRFTSQYSPELPKDWQWRACGIAAVKNIIDMWQAKDVGLPSPTLKEIFEKARAIGTYVDGVGWSHAGLVNTAKTYGYSSFNVDASSKPIEEIWKEIKKEVATHPVIASVKSKFDPTSKDGHLVIITKISKEQVHIVDPEEKGEENAIKQIDEKVFQSAFKKRYIVITPKTTTASQPSQQTSAGISNKLSKAIAAGIDIRKSLLAQVEGSVGSSIFRHLYQRKGKKLVDILGGGDVSCGTHISSMLYLWGLISDTHATVKSTIIDMESCGWYKISKPKPGCIIVWEQKDPSWGYWQHEHVGFYVGHEEAVSNNAKKGKIAKHHFTYGSLKGKPKRKITALYWHKALDK